MLIDIGESGVSGLRFIAAENSFEAVLPGEVLHHAEAWSLEAALTLAPGPGESVLEASRRIDGICRWAYIQMGRRRPPGGLQVRRTGVRMAGASARVMRGRVACP